MIWAILFSANASGLSCATSPCSDELSDIRDSQRNLSSCNTKVPLKKQIPQSKTHRKTNYMFEFGIMMDLLYD